MMNSTVLKVLEDYGITGTCDAQSVRPNCLTYCSSEIYWHKVAKQPCANVAILTYPGGRAYANRLGINAFVIESDDLEYDFVSLHNEINNLNQLPAIKKASGVTTHPGVEIGVEGTKIVKSRDGRLIAMKHMGSVILRKNVRVGANSIIHRGTLSDTVIDENVTIGALCNIGHNASIGPRCILTAGVIVAGSAVIGADCFLGIGSRVINGVRVCGRSLIAAGAVVTKDLQQPGKYAGVPAKWIGEWDGTW